MSPNKNLFAGALGKLQNIGGSKVFTIPHTVNVPVQYQVNSNLVGDFVTCSLDGRLWGLKRSNRFTFFALKWNPDTQKLEFAASLSRINENILARGLDWILTAKVMIKVLDVSPYITTLNLFNDSSTITLQEGQNIAHCYSILPPLCDFQLVDDVPTLVNEFQIVENFLVRRDINGYMLSRLIPLEFFQTRVLQSSPLFNDEISLSCSDNNIIAHNSRLWGAGKYALGKVFLLPAVFDSVGNATTFYLYFQHEHKLPRSPRFLRILIDNLTVTAFNGHSFALIRKLTSWEDAKNDCIARGGHLATCTSKEKYDFLDSLAEGTDAWLGAVREAFHDNWVWVNGEEWNYENWNNDYAGLNMFDSVSYGMYISSHPYYDDGWCFTNTSYTCLYVCEWDSLDVYDTYLHHMNDEPDSFSLAPAFLNDNLHGYKFNSGHNLCSMSDDNSLLNPVSGEWAAVSEHNGNIYFDINQSKAISLDDKGANFLHDDNVRFDCSTLNQWLAPANSIDALDDNLVVSSADNLSIVTHPDSGFMREGMLNKILPMSAPLGNGYRFSLGCSTNSSNRKIVDVNQIASNANSHQPILWDNVYKHALDLELVNVVRDVNIATTDSGHDVDECLSLITPFFCGSAILYRALDSSSSYQRSNLGFFPTGEYYHLPYYPLIYTEASVDVYYIDPLNGNVCFFDTLHATFSDYEFYFHSSREPNRIPKKFTRPSDYPAIINGKIGFPCVTYYMKDIYDDGYSRDMLEHREEFFLPLKDVPDDLKLWCIPNRLSDYLINLIPYTNPHHASGKQGIVLNSVTDSYARFLETSTNLPFALSCSDVPDINTRNISSIACELPYTNIDSNKKKFNHSIHVAGVKKGRNTIWMDYDGNIIYDILNYKELHEDAPYTLYDRYIYDLYIFRSQLHTDIFDFDSELQRSCLS